MLEDGGEVLDTLQCEEVTSKHPAEGSGLTPADLMSHTAQGSYYDPYYRHIPNAVILVRPETLTQCRESLAIEFLLHTSVWKKLNKRVSKYIFARLSNKVMYS